ncbi:uncharacterized protein LOC110979743 [Acanthaster planci]|uniref:Uncharacterized protein LOC110979743 n=1 Tax=Acanthaster planci TaxID=133434 RepID=A0A8B7YIP8_ACAPL|nr:uncharacterized protein LOC110979743 [Acanthaster planci]
MIFMLVDVVQGAIRQGSAGSAAVSGKMEPTPSVLLLFLTALFNSQANVTFAESKMRTLHFGDVSPAGPDDTFDRRVWLKAAMPKREDRCIKMAEHKEPEPSGNTVCGVMFEQSGPIWHPAAGHFDSPVQRLEFSVQPVNGDPVIVHLYDVNSNDLYRLVLAQQYCTISRRYEPLDSAMTKGLDLRGVSRFWLAHTDTEVQVGQAGGSAPIVRIPDADPSQHAVRRIKFLISAYKEWHIYAPCLDD